MKIQKFHVLSACIAATALICFAASVDAEHHATKDKDHNSTQHSQDGSHTRSGRLGNLDSTVSGSNIRVSELIGMNIQNQQGESVGEINDLVLNGNSGKIRYAAVTYGGFLGMGDKMFAVPFESFRVQTQEDDHDDHVLVLNVNEKQLEGAQGFDQDNWPDFANKDFTSDVDRRFGVDRNRKKDDHRSSNR